MNGLMKLIASVFYLGTFPVASGTVGTAGAAVVYMGLVAAGLYGAGLHGALLGLLAVSSLLCIPAGNWAERTYRKKDPGIVVLDEVAGYFIAVLFLPVNDLASGLTACLAAFFLFRVFDVLKPPPCRKLERLGGGLGILLDDLMAGVYTNLLLQIVLRWIVD